MYVTRIPKFSPTFTALPMPTGMLLTRISKLLISELRQLEDGAGGEVHDLLHGHVARADHHDERHFQLENGFQSRGHPLVYRRTRGIP
jgi:hypothetical protein